MNSVQLNQPGIRLNCHRQQPDPEQWTQQSHLLQTQARHALKTLALDNRQHSILGRRHAAFCYNDTVHWGAITSIAKGVWKKMREGLVTRDATPLGRGSHPGGNDVLCGGWDGVDLKDGLSPHKVPLKMGTGVCLGMETLAVIWYGCRDNEGKSGYYRNGKLVVTERNHPGGRLDASDTGGGDM
ncbi:hypothetical protein BaRGS_00003629, partial [Batillaria attramentaria]